MTHAVLDTLQAEARARGWTDRQWATAAEVRHETLSRVKRRGQCDTATLEALAKACAHMLRAEAVGAALDVDASGRWPRDLNRAAEESLLALAASGIQDPVRWRAAGPSFLMAGLAFMLSTQDDFDRVGYAALAEELHPGIGSHDAFRRWLRETPLKPYRVLPMLRQWRCAAGTDASR